MIRTHCSLTVCSVTLTTHTAALTLTSLKTTSLIHEVVYPKPSLSKEQPLFIRSMLSKGGAMAADRDVVIVNCFVLLKVQFLGESGHS